MGQFMCAQSVDSEIQKLNDQEKQMVNKLIHNNEEHSRIRPQHASYINPLGKINNPERCKDFSFLDPQSEVLLKDSYFNRSIGFNEQMIQIFYEQQLTYEALREALSRLVTEKEHLKKFYEYADEKIDHFRKQTQTDLNTAKACCLVLSYYTGFYGKNLMRNSNLLIKLQSMNVLQCIKRKQQLWDQICLGSWLLKAINYLPIHLNQTTRCINLTQAEQKYYEEGNLITWLQFSSASEGKLIPYGYEKRNTRFHISSISARKISDYSNFGKEELEVLFKPFTHFMILKKEKIDDIMHIYMRQIAIGQAKLNVLLVDDKIFQPNWQHKKLMETILKNNPRITIIPKSSTNTAMAFMASQLGNRRRKSDLRVVTTLERENQENKANAGIVLLKQLQEAYFVNLKMLILSDNVPGVEFQLKKMVVRQPFITISNNLEILKAFVSFK